MIVDEKLSDTMRLCVRDVDAESSAVLVRDCDAEDVCSRELDKLAVAVVETEMEQVIVALIWFVTVAEGDDVSLNDAVTVTRLVRVRLLVNNFVSE